MSSKHIHKSHNVTILLYHLVCPSKYRRKVFTDETETTLKNICYEIEQRYELDYIEIGADEDHIHFLIQTVPMMSPTQIVKKTKTITSKEMFRLHPELKKMLWGGHLWSSGYYMNTVGRHGNEELIRKYVQSQGKQYKQIHRKKLNEQLALFPS
jgi:REP element-mobilizing transposase RayT